VRRTAGRCVTRRCAIEALAVLGASSLAGGVRAEDGASPPPPTAKPRPAARGDAAKVPWLTLPATPSLPPATRSELATVNGVQVFFAQFGAGPHMLLLHGGLANSNYWGHQVAALAPRFTVTVMDTRGHGRSPVMSHEFGYRVFAEDVAALMDMLKLPPAAIVGWSDGAITGLQLAMTRPERVAKLFAFGANSSLDGLKSGGAHSPVFAQFAARCKAEYASLSPHPERWPQLLDGLRAMWRREPTFSAKQLASIRSPTAIADGEHDEIIKREHTARMAREIPGARLVIESRVSHFAMLQDPAQFNRDLADFLDHPVGAN
jgi:pimeloyl-ACP methyl ester carboxylesterase